MAQSKQASAMQQQPLPVVMTLPSIVSFDPTPAARTMARYLVVQGSVEGMGGGVLREGDVKAAVTDFNRRANERESEIASRLANDRAMALRSEIIRLEKRITDFVELIRIDEKGDDILSAARCEAERRGVDFSGKDMSLSNLKKMVRVLEEKFGMPLDLEASG